MILLQSQYQAEKNEENQFVLNFLLFGINNRSSSFFSFVFFIIFFIAIEPIHFSMNARCKRGNTKQEYQIMPTVIATTPRMHMCIHFFSSWISYLAHMICVRRCVSVTAIHVAYKYWWMRKKILWLYGFWFVWTILKKKLVDIIWNAFTPLNREFLAFSIQSICRIFYIFSDTILLYMQTLEF